MSSLGVTDRDRSVTLDSFNLGKTPLKIQVTCCGKVRAYSTFTYFEWAYWFISFVSLVISFGLTTERIVNGHLDSDDFTFGILLLLTIVFCGYYVIHAVMTERADELMVFVASNVIILIYCTVNCHAKECMDNTIKLVRLIVVWTLSPVLIVSGLRLCIIYCRSNNLLYNTVGPNASFQKICKLFYLCSSLLKFDLQLQLSMVVLVMGPQGTSMHLDQKIILGCGTFLTMLFITVGFLGLKRESHAMMILFFILGLSEPTYIAYKFYITSTKENKGNAIYESTFICGVLAFIVWLCLMISTSIFMTKYFNKGLKERMFENANSDNQNVPPSSLYPNE